MALIFEIDAKEQGHGRFGPVAQLVHWRLYLLKRDWIGELAGNVWVHSMRLSPIQTCLTQLIDVKKKVCNLDLV